MKSPTIGAAMLTVSSGAEFSDEELVGKKQDDQPDESVKGKAAQDAKSASRDASNSIGARAKPHDPDSQPATEEGVAKKEDHSNNS